MKLSELCDHITKLIEEKGDATIAEYYDPFKEGQCIEFDFYVDDEDESYVEIKIEH